MRSVGINHSSAMLTGRHALGRATREVSTVLERLSTGKRVNRASDDPGAVSAIAELTAREKTLRAHIDSLDREQAYLAAREGAESVVGDLLIDLRGHVVAAANRGGLSAEELEGHQLAAESILRTINHLADTSTFNGQGLLDGLRTHQLGEYFVTVTGADGQPETVTHTLDSLLGSSSLNLVTGDLETAQKVVDAAASSVRTSRGAVGLRMQNIDSQRRTGLQELEAVSGERSRVEDADMALETSNFVRSQVMQRAALYTTQLAGQLMATTALGLLGSSRM